jgi:hypothetical protein
MSTIPGPGLAIPAPSTQNCAPSQRSLLLLLLPLHRRIETECEPKLNFFRQARAAAEWPGIATAEETLLLALKAVSEAPNFRKVGPHQEIQSVSVRLLVWLRQARRRLMGTLASMRYLPTPHVASSVPSPISFGSQCCLIPTIFCQQSAQAARRAGGTSWNAPYSYLTELVDFRETLWASLGRPETPSWQGQ